VIVIDSIGGRNAAEGETYPATYINFVTLPVKGVVTDNIDVVSHLNLK
jgi:hypothetical protein